MLAPDGIWRKPAGAREPDGAGRAATGRTHPAAHGGSGGGAAAGEPRRWGRRLPACGHWSRHHGRGATPPGRRGPRRAG